MTTNFLKSSLILTLLFLLSACGQGQEQPQPQPVADVTQLNPAARVQALTAVKPSVQFNFAAKPEGENVIVEVWLENPEEKAVHSAEAWLTFNPEAIEVKDVRYSKAFPLPAPYEEPIDLNQGILKLGAATMADVKDKRFKFVEVTLAKEPGVTFLNFFDPAKSASVNTVVDKKPYNLLKEADSPALVLP